MDAVRTKFKLADKSKDRRLDWKEFKAFFEKEGMKERNIKKLFNKCDKDGNQKVTYSEFDDWMRREVTDGVMREIFKDMFVDDPKKLRDEAKGKKDKDDAKDKS